VGVDWIELAKYSVKSCTLLNVMNFCSIKENFLTISAPPVSQVALLCMELVSVYSPLQIPEGECLFTVPYRYLKESVCLQSLTDT
jgi:hypothetical protein